VVAAFYDMGNAMDDSNFEFKAGAGVGVRWVSPIGPIRIDVAKALDPIKPDDETKGWRLHISMGPDL
jgi:translocation and assembly module TamA